MTSLETQHWVDFMLKKDGRVYTINVSGPADGMTILAILRTSGMTHKSALYEYTAAPMEYEKKQIA